MYDILIKNGFYPDFKTMELVKADVAITNGKISAIGQLDDPSKEIIDASGRIVSPGFVDIHRHEENFLLEGNEYIISQVKPGQTLRGLNNLLIKNLTILLPEL